jgi:DNA-binding GntR family transcriptional regulator
MSQQLAPKARVKKLTETDVCLRVRESVLEQRLAPGTKLTEDSLCSIFAVNRSTVRKALVMLANDNIISLVKNKGAVVASPSPEEAHQIFEARTMMENALLRRTIKRADKASIARLREHLLKEQAALDKDDIPKWIRLSGEFHVVLGGASGNAPMCEFLEQLVFQSSLILALYGDQGHPKSCKGGEHERIVDAVEAGDIATATAIMAEHMGSLEKLLDFAPKAEAQDLAAILAGGT